MGGSAHGVNFTMQSTKPSIPSELAALALCAAVLLIVLGLAGLAYSFLAPGEAGGCSCPEILRPRVIELGTGRRTTRNFDTMNLKDFTEQQRQAVLDLAMLAMYADGHLASAEGDSEPWLEGARFTQSAVE